VVDAWAMREPGKLALLAVGPDGGDPRRFSFADLARSSDGAARFPAGQGSPRRPGVRDAAPRARLARRGPGLHQAERGADSANASRRRQLT